MLKLKPLITALLVLILLVTGCAKEKINLQQETKSPQPGQAENAPVPEQQQPFQTKQNTPIQLTPQSEQATSNQQQTQQPQKVPVSSEANYSLNVGGIFPPFTLPDLNGSEFNSKELFKNNKLTVVNVWSSTWGACIQEIPALEGLRKNYSTQGLGVIGIIVDPRNAERARQVLTIKGANFPNLLDDGKLGEKIYAVPQTYLVDRNGQIVQAVTGSRTLQQFSQLAEQFIKS